MNQRYTKLYDLPQNQYITGLPVILLAGALLKDNQTGKLLAQLKMKNITNYKLKALKVEITCKDFANRELEEKVYYQYMDLDIQRDYEFGTKKPIYVLNETTRSFSVKVLEVTTKDEIIWTSNNELEELNIFEKTQLNKEMLKQYKIKYKAYCKYNYSKQEDIWFCSCGGFNRNKEKCCHICNMELDKLENLDEKLLEEEMNIRLKKEMIENQKKLEQNEVIRKRKRNFIIMVLTIIILSIIMIDIVSNYKEKNIVEIRANVLAVGNNNSYKCDVSSWSDIIEVSAGDYHTVGIKSNGTVVTVGNNDYNQCEISSWNDIMSISAGNTHTVGLKSDGTVLAVGNNTYKQCEVSSWSDIVSISAGLNHTVGLKSDGTVMVSGSNSKIRDTILSWKDILFISAGDYHTVGLKLDGTVLAVGNNTYSQCEVSSWRDIIQVSAGNNHTIGLKSDGTVVAVGKNDDNQCEVSSWRDVISVSAGESHIVGIKAN